MKTNVKFKFIVIGLTEEGKKKVRQALERYTPLFDDGFDEKIFNAWIDEIEESDKLNVFDDYEIGSYYTRDRIPHHINFDPQTDYVYGIVDFEEEF